MKRVPSSVAKSMKLVGMGYLIGILIGIFGKSVHYSIIHHEAKKGDQKAQAIADQFDEVDAKIENVFTKKV